MDEGYQGKKIRIIKEHLDKIQSLKGEQMVILGVVTQQEQIYVVQYDQSYQQNSQTDAKSKEDLIKQINNLSVHKKVEMTTIRVMAEILQSGSFVQVVSVQQINTIINKLAYISIRFNELIEPILKLTQVDFELIGCTIGEKGRVRKSQIENKILKINQLEGILNTAFKLLKQEKSKIDAQLFQKLNSLLPIYSFEVELIPRITVLQVNNISDHQLQKDQVFTSNYLMLLLNSDDPISVLALSLRLEITSIVQMIKSKAKLSQKKPTFFPKQSLKSSPLSENNTKTQASAVLSKGMLLNFNDQGWGCAYRSLQTVISWLHLQSYINIDQIPSILNIQNTLDIINSTASKLAHTQTWIGATEVSWYIKHLSGLDSRILHISNGAAISEHLQVFRQYLEKTGCPIMFGGGEYAYCVVGMNYCWSLGEVQFLILDPHYNGNDSIDKIIERKGVCWRKPDEMFKNGIFYNFCMPIIQQK